MKESKKTEQINIRLTPDAQDIIADMGREDLRSPTDIGRIGLILYAEKYHPKIAAKLRELIRP
jgi:hypothetical protein